jgi:hypothetical protein
VRILPFAPAPVSFHYIHKNITKIEHGGKSRTFVAASVATPARGTGSALAGCLGPSRAAAQMLPVEINRM